MEHDQQQLPLSTSYGMHSEWCVIQLFWYRSLSLIEVAHVFICKVASHLCFQCSASAAILDVWVLVDKTLYVELVKM